MPTDDLLRTVMDEMPPFPERASALLSRLHSRQHNTTDKRTWVAGGKDANKDINERNNTLKRTFSAGNTLDTTSAAQSPVKANGTKTPADELAGLDWGTSEAKTPNFASADHLSPGWERGHARMLMVPEGILYEDSQIQVGVRSEYRGELGCIIMYFTNKSSFAINSFTTTLNNPSAEHIKIDVKSLPETTVQPSTQTQAMIMLEARSVFTLAPTIRISWLAGALQALTLQLPLAIHKYLEPAQLSADDFFKRWKQIGGPGPREAQRIFSGKDVAPVPTRRILEGFKWGVLDEVDPNKKNFVAASVLHTSQAGKIGCLVRLEPNTNNGVSFCSKMQHGEKTLLLTFVNHRCIDLLSELLMNLYRRFLWKLWRRDWLWEKHLFIRHRMVEYLIKSEDRVANPPSQFRCLKIRCFLSIRPRCLLLP